MSEWRSYLTDCRERRGERQRAIIVAISERGEADIRALGATTGMDHTTLHIELRALVDGGLLERHAQHVAGAVRASKRSHFAWKLARA